FHRRPQPGNHVLDPFWRAALHVYEHQHYHVQEQVAGGLDPTRVHAPVPSGPGDYASHPVHHHVLRDLPGIRVATDRDGDLLCRRVAVVPLLPLPVCAARRSIHHAVAEATGLLTNQHDAMARLLRRAILFSGWVCGVRFLELSQLWRLAPTSCRDIGRLPARSGKRRTGFSARQERFSVTPISRPREASVIRSLPGAIAAIRYGFARS